MGLNPRGRGRGRGNKGNFLNKPRRVGGMGAHGPMFRGNPMGMFCSPPMGFPPEPPFGPPFFPGPSGFNFGPPRPTFGKFPRKNFKKKISVNANETSLPEIDLTKPWVTEEIKSEETKKQECLETWRKSKNDSDWNIYKTQKKIVQNLYDKAKAEYLESHPEEASLWQHLPPRRKHYCETCDKSFKSEDNLIFHQGEHEMCGKDGCTFTAHPKIIAKHIRMQHDSGLYKRIGNLYTKEEIAKWIEERKKRYPSKKVIEEKKALEAEKWKRGEKIKNDNCKFNKNSQKKNKNRKYKANKIKKFKRVRQKTKNYLIEISAELKAESQRNGIPCFNGIKNFESVQQTQKKGDEDISDDESYALCNAEALAKPMLNKSLGLLASIYYSEEESAEEVSPKKNKDSEITDEESAPDEVKTIFKKDSQDIEPKVKIEKKVTNKKKISFEKRSVGEKKQRNNGNEYRKLTLLEKLLSKEIKHERNVILQCVHYVVSNNFFV